MSDQDYNKRWKEAFDRLSPLRSEVEEEKNKNRKAADETDRKERKINEQYQQDDKARNTLTFHFLWGFFALISGCFLFVLIYNSTAVKWIEALDAKNIKDATNYIKLLELDKVLSVLIGALGTSLGFIIGYYFKEKKQ